MGDPESEEFAVEEGGGEVMAADMPTDKKNFHRMIRLFGLPCLLQRRAQMSSTKHLQCKYNS